MAPHTDVCVRISPCPDADTVMQPIRHSAMAGAVASKATAMTARLEVLQR